MTVAAVTAGVSVAVPPAQCGAATTTRKSPSALGLKLTCTLVGLTTEADTSRPPAVIADSDPKVWPLGSCSELSTQVSASVPVVPLTAAVGFRPDHRLIDAVWATFGLAPLTSTISSSLAVETQAFMDSPPPDSSRTPSVRSSLPLKSDAWEITDRPGMFTWPGDFRSGMVSDRLSCAVKPFAAQAATPSAPLPSGIDAVGLMLGWPSTMSSRLTTPSGSRAKVAVAPRRGGRGCRSARADPVAASAGSRAAREDQAGRGGEGRGGDRGQPPGAGDRAPARLGGGDDGTGGVGGLNDTVASMASASVDSPTADCPAVIR